MRIRTSLAIISVLFATDALAAGMAPNSRTRPGSVTGALLQSAQTAARMPGLDVNNCPGCQPASTPTPTPTPTPDPCGEVIPQLGVDICVARSACAGIQADGHGGVFDEASLTCKIPVCAHNWSGIIKKDGADVCGLVNMNTALRCDANLFDQIDVMRRTSQWVVPLTVAGGAGIGAGVGAIIDNQNEKREKAAFEAGRQGVEPGSLNASVAAEIQIDGQPASPELLAAALTKAEDNIKKCAAEAFTELVSPNYGVCKLGRIKITSGANCDVNSNDAAEPKTSTGGFPYCSYNYVHKTDSAGNASSLVKGNCNGTEDAYVQCPSVGFSTISSGTCYYRDEVTGTNADRGYQGSNRPNIFALDEDSTAAYDKHRAEMLKNLGNAIDANDTAFGELKKAIDKVTITAGAATQELEAGGVRNSNSMDYVKITTSDTFGNILSQMTGGSGVTSGACKAATDDLFGGETLAKASAGNTIERMNQAVGYFEGLGYSQDLIKRLKVVASARAEISFTYDSYDDWDNSSDGKKGFFQKAVGRGLLIGTGAGAAAGLGYWFAEGASTFCNVGGMQQVKLGKSYSIQSFRDYLYSKGFIK